MARERDFGSAAMTTTNSQDLARKKAAEAAERQKAMILAMKEKYRQSSKTTNLQGGAPVEQSQYPVPAQVSPELLATPISAATKGEVTASDEQSSWGLERIVTFTLPTEADNR